MKSHPLIQLPTVVIRALVVGYRALLSPFLHTLMPGFGCRFHPTCSEYALQSLNAHGLIRGGRLVIWRLAKCHPFHPGGCDPVPPPATELKT